jgi:hypothetical protein
MLRIRHTRREHAVDGAEGVTLTFATSGFQWASSFGGGGFTYHRPILVRHEPTGSVRRVQDHVMAVRLAGVAALLLALVWRWIDDK